MTRKVTRAWPWHGVAVISRLVRSWLGAHQRRTGGSAAACGVARAPCSPPMRSRCGGTCVTRPTGGPCDSHPAIRCGRLRGPSNGVGDGVVEQSHFPVLKCMSVYLTICFQPTVERTTINKWNEKCNPMFIFKECVEKTDLL